MESSHLHITRCRRLWMMGMISNNGGRENRYIVGHRNKHLQTQVTQEING